MLTRYLLIAALCCPGLSFAVELPCKLETYRIPTVSQLAILCRDGLAGLDASARLFPVLNGSASPSDIAQATLSVQDFNWIVVDLKQPLAGGKEPPLAGGKEYELLLTGRFRPVRPGAEFSLFEQRFRFHTKPGATLTVPSHTPSTSLFYGSELWIESPIELVPPVGFTLESEDAPAVFVPHRPSVDLDRRDGGFDQIGSARLTFARHDAPARLNARFRSSSLRDIFGQTVPLKSAKRLALPSSPKAKDDAVYYAKILHQAGANSRPAWILDGKLAPVFAIRRLANWQLRPSAESDIGQGGAIGKTKTNDYIKFGLGIGRFLRTPHAGPVQGIDPTLGAAYETNYSGAKRNLLAIFDFRFALAGSDQSLKQKNFIRFIQQRDCDPLPPEVTPEQCKQNAPTEPQDASKARFGYQFRTSAGVEIGRQISDIAAKASEGDSSVKVPAYPIARIRPKLELDLEFPRLTFTLSGTPRYLARTENVYRERDVIDSDGKTTKEVFLDQVSGWRPSGELSVSIPLDEAGRFAVSSSLKLGSLPPNFQRVAIVQSGVTLKF
jgi:hypothetical protein